MDSGIAKELLDELIPHLETIETQSAAVMRFLKEKGIATEKDLAPYLDEAGKASNVRWRASRLRIERLLSSLIEELEKAAKQAIPEKPAEPKTPPEASKETEPTKEAEAAEKEDTANASDKAPVAPSKVPAAEKHDAARQQSEEQAESEKKLPEDQKDAA